MSEIKVYQEPDGSTILDGDTGGEPRKVGLLLPKEPPKLYASFSEHIPVLSEPEIRKLVDDPQRKSGRKLFGRDIIKDQNGRGACQGYACAGALERARVRVGMDHVKLSGDFAYCLVNGGRDSGSHLAAGMEAVQAKGVCTEATVKRLGLVHEYRQNRFPQECFAEAERFRGVRGEVYHCDTEAELMTAAALGFDLVVAVHAGGSGGLDQYGIVQWGNGSGNHAVICDDLVYDRRMSGYKFDHPNSWSPRWGDEGRSYLTFDRHFQRSIKVHRFYAYRAATEDPQGDNPPEPK